CFAPYNVRDRRGRLGPGSGADCDTAQARLVEPHAPSVFFRANPEVQRSKIARSRPRLANNAADNKTLGGPTAQDQIDVDESIETSRYARISNKPANRNLLEVLCRGDPDEMVRQSRHRRKTWNVCDYHTHPQGHRVQPYTPELLQPWADSARKIGLSDIAFTDHDRYHSGIDFDEIDRLRDKNVDLKIRAGIELDNDPVYSKAGRKWVEQHWNQLDCVLGSVHFLDRDDQMFDSVPVGAK